MSRSITEELDALAEDFDVLDNWEERYRYVIELGRELPPFPEEARTDANKVRGCASQVWLTVNPQSDGRLTFQGDSDAHIVKGLMAIVLRLYSGHSPQEIAAFDARAAVERLGLSGALSSQRANGLGAMVDRIRAEALAAA